jgi:hypothetical protein
MSTPAIALRTGRPLPRPPAENKPFDKAEFKKCQENAALVSKLISENKEYLSKVNPDIVALQPLCDRIVANKENAGSYLCNDAKVRVLLSRSPEAIQGLISNREACKLQ